jgi:hypothetical protein
MTVRMLRRRVTALEMVRWVLMLRMGEEERKETHTVEDRGMARLTHQVYLLQVQIARIFDSNVKVEISEDDHLIKFAEVREPEDKTDEEIEKEENAKKEKQEFRKQYLFAATGFNPVTGEFRTRLPPPR